jgi:hypothetical protein
VKQLLPGQPLLLLHEPGNIDVLLLLRWPLLLLLLVYTLQDLVKQLMPGQPLMFQQEPSNPADPSAIHVTTLDGASVGYIAQHLTSAFTLPVRSIWEAWVHLH